MICFSLATLGQPLSASLVGVTPFPPGCQPYPIRFFLLLFFIGGYLLYNTVLVSVLVHQHESAKGMHRTPPS